MKIVSENRFSGKTYLHTIASSARGDQRLMDTDDDASVISDVPNGKTAGGSNATGERVTRNEQTTLLGYLHIQGSIVLSA